MRVLTAQCVEALESRTMLSTVTVNTGTTLRAVPSNFLGVNTAPWDGLLTSPTTLSLSKAAGIGSVRIGGGSYIDETSSSGVGWHFDVSNQTNSLPQQLAFITGLGATGIIDLNYGTSSPQEAVAELAYLNAPINNATIDNISIGAADKFTGTAIGNGSITGSWVTGGGVAANGVTSWQTVGFWASLRAASPITPNDGLNFLRLGQTAPFGFHYYEIGNEIYGSWEADTQGTTTAANDLTGLLPNSAVPKAHDPTTIIAWGKVFESFSNQIDSTISVGIDCQSPVGTDSNGWLNGLLTQTASQGFTLGYIADHYYTNISAGSENDTTLLGTPNTSATGNTYDLSQRISAYDSLIASKLPGKNVQLLVDEFNSVANNPGKQTTSLVNALYVADAIGAALNTTGSSGLGGAQGVWLWDLHNGPGPSATNQSSSLYGWRTATDWGDYGMLGAGTSAAGTGSGSNWEYPDYFAMQMLSKFAITGGTIVSASEDNETSVDTYSILEPNGHLELLVINKSKGTLGTPPNNLPAPTLTEQFNISGFSPSNVGTVWQYGAAEDDAEAVAANGIGSLTKTTPTLNVVSGGFSYALPDYSMTLFDLAPGPAVATIAAAAPSPITGTTTLLTALGVENGSDAGLIYTWSATGPAAVTYGDNGTNTAKSSTATFIKAGSYVFTVTISDANSGTITSSVNVTVNQTLTAIAVSPGAPSVANGQTQSLSGLGTDQFNNPMTASVLWSIDGGGVGSVNSSGVYTAPAGGPGSATVRASSGSFSGTATVAVNFTTIAGTAGSDNIKLIGASGGMLQVSFGGVLQYSASLASLGALTVNGLGGNDTVTIDFSGLGGSPVPAAGITVKGVVSVVIAGTDADDATNVSASSIVFDGSTINYLNDQSIIINSGMGTDTLTQSATPSATLAFNPLSGAAILNINAGSFAIPGSAGGLAEVSFGSLSIAAGAALSVGGASDPLNHDVLVLGNLSNAGKLDLGANDLILQGGGTSGLGLITTQLAAGFNAGHGYWNGSTGIVSTAAAGDGTFLSTLGVMENTTGQAFQGVPSSVGDVLVKHTYYGDADLNGVVNGADYQQIDNGFGLQAGGWTNGDFNYDGVINGSDFALIDNAFNQITALGASALVVTAGRAVVSARVVAAMPWSASPFSQSANIVVQDDVGDLLKRAGRMLRFVT